MICSVRGDPCCFSGVFPWTMLRCDAKASGWGTTEMQDSRREEKKSRRKKGRRQGILGSFMKFGIMTLLWYDYDTICNYVLFSLLLSCCLHTSSPALWFSLQLPVPLCSSGGCKLLVFTFLNCKSSQHFPFISFYTVPILIFTTVRWTSSWRRGSVMECNECRFVVKSQLVHRKCRNLRDFHVPFRLVQDGLLRKEMLPRPCLWFSAFSAWCSKGHHTTYLYGKS